MTTPLYSRTSSPPKIDLSPFLKDNPQETSTLIPDSLKSISKTEVEPLREVRQELGRLHNNNETPSSDFFDLRRYGLNDVGTMTVKTEHGTMEVTRISVEEEIRRVTAAMDKKHLAYKYYSFIGGLSVTSLAVFTTLGLSGVIGPATFAVGGLMSSIGIVGSYLDWKDWLNKNAY